MGGFPASMEINIIRLSPATHLFTQELEQPQQPGDGRGGESGKWLKGLQMEGLKGLVFTPGSAPVFWRLSFHHTTKQRQSKVCQCLRKRTPTGHSEDPPQGHPPAPHQQHLHGDSKKPPRWGHESLWQSEGGFSSHWRGQDGNHPSGILDLMRSQSTQPENTGSEKYKSGPTLILTLKPASTLLGHCQLLQQRLLPHAPSLKSPTTSDVSPFPLA